MTIKQGKVTYREVTIAMWEYNWSSYQDAKKEGSVVQWWAKKVGRPVCEIIEVPTEYHEQITQLILGAEKRLVNYCA